MNKAMEYLFLFFVTAVLAICFALIAAGIELTIKDYLTIGDIAPGFFLGALIPSIAIVATAKFMRNL